MKVFNPFQTDFLNKRIEDLRKQCDQYSCRYEDKLSNFHISQHSFKLESQKQEIIQDFTCRIKSIKDEKSTLSDKFNKTKSQLKDVQSHFNKELLRLEREKAMYMEKINNFETKKKEINAKHIDQIKHYE